MATQTIFLLSILSSLALSATGLGIDLSSIPEDNTVNEDRTFIIGATSNVPFNASQLATIIGLLAAALLPLLALSCLCALALGFLLYNGDQGESYSSYGSSYRALGLSGLEMIDWEQLSIIDWVSMGEETFRKFDPSNLDCQKRVICELHQNVKQFGTIASRIVDAFGYLKYLQVFNMPQIVTDITTEYLDAADTGRSLQKSCGDIFGDCDFSIKAMYDRYSRNEVD